MASRTASAVQENRSKTPDRTSPPKHVSCLSSMLAAGAQPKSDSVPCHCWFAATSDSADAASLQWRGASIAVALGNIFSKGTLSP